MMIERWMCAGMFLASGCYDIHGRDVGLEPDFDAGPFVEEDGGTVSPAIGAARLGVGKGFACVLADDGSVWCWGIAETGELGDGSITSAHAAPARVLGLDGVTQLAVGLSHACALRAAGDIWCWGLNAWGQLGTGAPEMSCEPGITNGFCSPVPVRSGFPPAVGVAAGGGSTCAWTFEGRVYCTDNSDSEHIEPPGLVPGLEDIVQVAMGWNLGRSALSRRGRIHTWGGNGNGQAGQGPDAISDYAISAGSAIGAPPALEIASGGFTTCALDGSRQAWCAGLSPFAPHEAIGNPVTTDVFVREPLLDGLRQLNGDTDHFCGLRDATLVCGGQRWGGVLGDGSEEAGTLPPQIVEGLGRVTVVDTGASCTCGIIEDREIWCWGLGGAAAPGWWDGEVTRPERVPFEL
jgi:alpha-tubulin suppressor-like RCC1 family protein